MRRAADSADPISNQKVHVRGNNDESLRWHALQIAAQLPENRELALRVLELTGDLVRTWLHAKPDEQARQRTSPVRVV